MDTKNVSMHCPHRDCARSSLFCLMAYRMDSMSFLTDNVGSAYDRVPHCLPSIVNDIDRIKHLCIWKVYRPSFQSLQAVPCSALRSHAHQIDRATDSYVKFVAVYIHLLRLFARAFALMPSKHPSSSSWASRRLQAAVPPIFTKQVALERNGQNVTYKTSTRLSLYSASNVSPREFFFAHQSEPYIKLRRSSQRLENFLDDEDGCGSANSSAVMPTARFSFDLQGGQTYEASPSPPALPPRLQHRFSRGGSRPLRVINVSPEKELRKDSDPQKSDTPRLELVDRNTACWPLPRHSLPRRQWYFSSTSQSPDACIGRAIWRRPVRPRRYKRKGPAVCPISTREYHASLRRPAALRHTTLPSVADEPVSRWSQAQRCRGCTQMISESIHHRGLEKRLPLLPFETLFEGNETDGTVSRSKERMSEADEALALAIAIQDVSPVLILEECPRQQQSYYDDVQAMPTNAFAYKPHNTATIEHTEKMQSKHRTVVSDIGALFPDTETPELRGDSSEDIWLELADEEKRAIDFHEVSARS